MFRCGIIGCGNIAGGYDRKVPKDWSFTHAGAYHLCPETRLVAAADPSPEVLQKFGEKWGIDKLYEDYRDMLKDEAIDILSLCLPTERHFDAFKFACKTDIPAIFCEKPLSYDLKEAKDMLSMSKGRIVSVNYFRRWNPTIVQLRNEISGGVYGRVINIVARYTKGILVNGSHLVDLMRWFFGEPEGIYLIKINNREAKDPGVDFVLTFKGNITVYFLNIPDVEYVFIDVDILTEKGRLTLAQRGQQVEKHSIIVEPYYQKFNILKLTDDIETAWRDCLTRAVQEIVYCLKNGGQTSCSPEDGLKALEICCKVIKG